MFNYVVWEVEQLCNSNAHVLRMYFVDIFLSTKLRKWKKNLWNNKPWRLITNLVFSVARTYFQFFHLLFQVFVAPFLTLNQLKCPSINPCERDAATYGKEEGTATVYIDFILVTSLENFLLFPLNFSPKKYFPLPSGFPTGSLHT